MSHELLTMTVDRVGQTGGVTVGDPRPLTKAESAVLALLLRVEFPGVLEMVRGQSAGGAIRVFTVNSSAPGTRSRRRLCGRSSKDAGLITTGARTRCDTTNTTPGQFLIVSGWILRLLAWACSSPASPAPSVRPEPPHSS